MSTEFEVLQEEHKARGELIEALNKIIYIQAGQSAEMVELFKKQKRRIGELEYLIHRYSECYKHPIGFLMWTLFKDVWPFRFWYGRHQ